MSARIITLPTAAAVPPPRPPRHRGPWGHGILSIAALRRKKTAEDAAKQRIEIIAEMRAIEERVIKHRNKTIQAHGGPEAALLRAYRLADAATRENLLIIANLTLDGSRSSEPT
jgi:hypothetical protein